MSISVWIIIVGTAAIAAFSWIISLRSGRFHGITRFFAFESLLALFLLNVPYWFRNPLSLRQIFSWIFLFGSMIPVVWGAVLLIGHGKPEGQWENTTRLVTTGIYRRIRHPLYASLAYLGIGIFLKDVTLATSALLVVDGIAVFLTAIIEEREMKARFGEAYAVYMKSTKRFMPFIF